MSGSLKLVQNNSPEISVIVPVYNADKYLRECLDSIVNQTLRNIEIILVDDGSTDDSLNILKEYAEKDTRILILQQGNKGAGAARNRGLEVARGKYLSILDSDDIFDTRLLELLHKKIDKDDLDIVICKSQKLNARTNSLEQMPYALVESYLPAKSIFNYSDFPKYIMNFSIGWAWDKLFRRTFVEQYKIRFQELRSQNDIYFVMSALVLAKKISILNEFLIKHREYTGTQISETRDKNSNCYLLAFEKIYKTLNEYGLYAQVEQSFLNLVVHHSFWQLDTLSINNSYAHERLLLDFFEKLDIFNKPLNYFYDGGLICKLRYLKAQNSYALSRDIERLKYTCNEIRKILEKDKLTIFQKIFSVKNSSDRKSKLVTILGIRIRFRKY